jgi:hypothetical protein
MDLRGQATLKPMMPMIGLTVKLVKAVTRRKRPMHRLQTLKSRMPAVTFHSTFSTDRMAIESSSVMQAFFNQLFKIRSTHERAQNKNHPHKRHI